jgi:prepilin-type N-terminal cleavage/methylation domain-containing protein
MKPRTTHLCKPAFTLVELLDTIAIIATLASLIFMMARRGIDSARTSKSVSNLQRKPPSSAWPNLHPKTLPNPKH